MRFEHQGMALWFGTPDAPAPIDVVTEGHEVTITVGVAPADASNVVKVLYRTNNGSINTVNAKWYRSGKGGSAQYYLARLSPFHVGDVAEYTATCTCVGRQVPSPDDANRLASSFRVVQAQSKPEPGIASVPAAP